MSESNSRRRERIWTQRLNNRCGFTLVEVLVAFTVMAMLLSVLFRGVVMMRTGSIVYGDRTRLEVAARALLNDALAERHLASGRYTGVRDGRHWTLIAQLVDLSEQLPPPQREDAELNVGDPLATAPGATEFGGNAHGNQNHGQNWSLQQVIVRIETNGKPLEIETVRMVSLERVP